MEGLLLFGLHRFQVVLFPYSFSLYGIHCLAASISWGVLFSATWGRFGGSGHDAVTQRKGYSFRAAGNLAFTLTLFGLACFLAFFLAKIG